ncbi:MAG: adenylyl-sulfate kinase [Bacteroidota bacterium]|nr:adenylyl-sulfate kinase [Bacteroidota bacterium]
MEGDIIITEAHHRKAAAEILDILGETIKTSVPFTLTIAGESGSGKSEIATALADALKEKNIKTYILQQDDYFFLPPKTNENQRRNNIEAVGTQEVNLTLMNEHISTFKQGESLISKSLVVFADDRITTEKADLSDVDVLIAEGTFTTLLDAADVHVFIDRNLNDTLESRKKRNREKQDAFLEQVLTIEHAIISKHKAKADLIVDKDYHVHKKVKQ